MLFWPSVDSEFPKTMFLEQKNRIMFLCRSFSIFNIKYELPYEENPHSIENDESETILELYRVGKSFIFRCNYCNWMMECLFRSKL